MSIEGAKNHECDVAAEAAQTVAAKAVQTVAAEAAQTLEELKTLLATHLREPDRLKKSEGLPTGMASLDQFLVSGGIPKGALSLFHGALGMGSTSLWLECAARVLHEEKWVAWIDGEVPLSPVSLAQTGANLARFVTIARPENDRQLFLCLQELMSSSLFDLIGCDVGSRLAREHQLRKLQTQARVANTALVFLAPELQSTLAGSRATAFSLILGFEKRALNIERAMHRPTPHHLTRSLSYARFTHVLTGPVHHSEPRSGAESNLELTHQPELGKS